MHKQAWPAAAALEGVFKMIRHFFLFAAAPGRQEEAERALCEWLASSKQFPQFLGGAVLRARAGELGDMPPPLAVTYDVKSREEGKAFKAASKSIPNPMSEDIPGIEDQGHVLFGGGNGYDHGSHGHNGHDHHGHDHDHDHPDHEEGRAHLEVSSEALAKLRFDRGGGLLARLMHAHFELLDQQTSASR